MKELNIVLFDANSFFASCHQADDRDLINKPVIVAGDPKQRSGIVLAASHEARRFGVKTTMPLFKARALCPQTIILQPDFSLYSRLSDEMWNIVGRYVDSAHMEIVSIDECFADFSGSHLLFGNTEEIARRVQKEIWEELMLGVSVGISYCKSLAKLASEQYRHPRTGLKLPRGFIKIGHQDLAEKVWPLPVGDLSGVGKKLSEHLKALNIHTIGDLAHADSALLSRELGVSGPALITYALGEDVRPVSPHQTVKNHSIGRSVTLSEDIGRTDEVAQVLLALSDSVGRKVRKEKLQARCVTLQIKTPSFKTYTFSQTLSSPIHRSEDIYREGLRLFSTHWPKDQLIRLLGITLSQLVPQSNQLSLFQDQEERSSHLTETVDSLRDRYGSMSVIRGTQLLDLCRRISTRRR